MSRPDHLPAGAPLGICRDCRQPVLWVITAAGRHQALNTAPDPAGNVAVYRDGTGAWRARVPTAELPAAPYEHIYMPHPATCTALAAKRIAAKSPNVINLADRRRRRAARRPS